MPKIKTVRGIQNRKVVSQEQWLVARKELLDAEKELTRRTPTRHARGGWTSSGAGINGSTVPRRGATGCESGFAAVMNTTTEGQRPQLRLKRPQTYMEAQPQSKNSTCGGESALPAGFIAVCALAFVVGVAATVYFCRSMSGGMGMPGGWTMSMMWMRMPGQTWIASAISFLLMWLAMMVAMMLPSALPTFLKTRRRWISLCYMASGYFAIWLGAGVGIYMLGVALATEAMRSDLMSRAVPWLLGASLIAAGAAQFTRWKMTHLLRCRSPFGCAASCPQNETSFQLGCKQGVECCLCCASPMTILLALGMINPLVIIVVAIVIAAEKLLPQPAIVARLVGISASIAGITIIARILRTTL